MWGVLLGTVALLAGCSTFLGGDDDVTPSGIAIGVITPVVNDSALQEITHPVSDPDTEVFIAVAALGNELRNFSVTDLGDGSGVSQRTEAVEGNLQLVLFSKRYETPGDLLLEVGSNQTTDQVILVINTTGVATFSASPAFATSVTAEAMTTGGSSDDLVLGMFASANANSDIDIGTERCTHQRPSGLTFVLTSERGGGSAPSLSFDGTTPWVSVGTLLRPPLE